MAGTWPCDEPRNLPGGTGDAANTGMSDSRDFVNTERMYRRALQVDWRRLMSLDRFAKFFKAGDGVNEENVKAVLDMLKENRRYATIFSIFEYYCCFNLNQPFTMSLGAYNTLMKESGVEEEGGTTDDFAVGLALIYRKKCSETRSANIH